MKRYIVTLLVLLVAVSQTLASDFAFSKGAGGASFGDAPEALTALTLSKTGEEDGADVYRSAAQAGDLDGLPLISREYAFTGGKLVRVTLYFNAWHVDDAMKLAKKNLGEVSEENALFARFETDSAVVTLLKKKAALVVSPKQAVAPAQPGEKPAADIPAGVNPAAPDPAAAGGAQAADSAACETIAPLSGVETKSEAKPEATPKAAKAKDAELLSQTKLLAYSLNMILDKMDTLETDSAQNRISFNAYSEAYGKLAKESEALTSRYPKADIKLQEFSVVLNNLVSDLTFLTQKILSVQTDASLSGSLLNSAVSGATGNYLGVINCITNYFGSSKNEEKIKNDIVALRKRFAATREEFAKKLRETRSHVKEEYDISF